MEYKKDNKLNSDNYRGILVSSTISRTYYIIIKDVIESEFFHNEDETEADFQTGRL